MKKKSLVTMVASLALVGAVGVGSTLAYLSSTTGTLVNTFSTASGYTGKDQAVQIQETKYLGNDEYGDKTSYGEDGFAGNAYTNLLPGDSVTKDPNVVLGENSIDSYIFILVDGADDLVAIDNDEDGAGDFTIDTFNSKWEKADDSNGLDGIYVYKAGEGVDAYKVTKGESTEDLFTTVTYNKEVTADVAVELPEIVLQAYAVQYKNVSLEEAKELVISGNPVVLDE